MRVAVALGSCIPSGRRHPMRTHDRNVIPCSCPEFAESPCGDKRIVSFSHPDQSVDRSAPKICSRLPMRFERVERPVRFSSEVLFIGYSRGGPSGLSRGATPSILRRQRFGVLEPSSQVGGVACVGSGSRIRHGNRSEERRITGGRKLLRSPLPPVVPLSGYPALYVPPSTRDANTTTLSL